MYPESINGTLCVSNIRTCFSMWTASCTVFFLDISPLSLCSLHSDSEPFQIPLIKFCGTGTRASFRKSRKATLISLCEHSRLRLALLRPRYDRKPTGYRKSHCPGPTRISVLNRAALNPFSRSCG